jgi:predicted small lipoprotein YifL
MRHLSLLLVLLTLAACGREGPALPFMGGDPDVQTLNADQLDTLTVNGVTVSVSGTVLDQDETGRRLIVDDGTGLVQVELPEAVPMLSGLRFSAWGPLERRDDGPVVRATEWLYDSTAVPVRSE